MGATGAVEQEMSTRSFLDIVADDGSAGGSVESIYSEMVKMSIRK